MKKWIIILIGIMFMLASHVSAGDNRPYKTTKGQVFCLLYSDIELIGKLAQQKDTEAFIKMLDNKRCSEFKGGEIIYKIDYIAPYTKVRAKGNTIGVWTLI